MNHRVKKPGTKLRKIFQTTTKVCKKIGILHQWYPIIVLFFVAIGCGFFGSLG
jgi:hypothetical protein